MMRAEAFTILSLIFAPASREDWEAVTGADVWPDFLTALARLTVPAPARDAALARLAVPPTCEEKAHFGARHFTGGLPDSALPVESLYAAPAIGQTDANGTRKAAGATERAYLRAPARYMRDLAAALGLEIPAAFVACPDHLSLELEIAALLHGANPDDARDFAAHRFAWLPAYADRLRSIGADASFYGAAIDLLICLIDAWRKEK